MPKNDKAGPGGAPDLAPVSVSDADDDVVDLLEVVKPGKPQTKPPADDVDFSADLESMLDTLSAAEKAHDEAEQAEAAGAFPDPTPVDHEVDHDESLDMPGMEDLDAILDSLGGDAVASAPTGESTEDAGSADADLSMPDLDALPAAAPSAAKSPDALDADYLDSFLDESESNVPAAPQKAVAKSAPAADLEAQDLLADLGFDLANDAHEAAEEAPEDLSGLLLDPEAPPPSPEGHAAPASNSFEDDLLIGDPLPEPPPAEAPAAGADPLEDALSDGDAVRDEENDLFADLLDPGESKTPDAAVSADTAEETPEPAEDNASLADALLADFPSDHPDAQEEKALPMEEADPLFVPDDDMPAPDQELEADTMAEQAAEPATPALPAETEEPVAPEMDIPLGEDLDAELDLSSGMDLDAELDAALAVDAAPAVEPLEQPDDDDELAESLDTAAGDIASEALDMSRDLSDDDVEALVQSPKDETPVSAPGDVTEHATEPAETLPEPPPPAAAPSPEPAPERAPPAARDSATGSRFDEVDLNELDALLDNMLASAPASGPAPAPAAAQTESPSNGAAPIEAPAPDRDTGSGPAPESGFQGMVSELAAMRLELDSLKEKVDALAWEAEDGVNVSLADVASRLNSQASALSAQAEKLEDLEHSIADQSAQATEKAAPTSEMADKLQYMEGQILALDTKSEEDDARAAAQETRVQALEERLSALDERFSGLDGRLAGLESRFEELSANIDKTAAEAAARIIREEIVALLSEAGT